MDRARFADRRAHEVVDVRHGADALEAISREGFWAVVATFEGEVTAVRFAVVEQGRSDESVAPPWTPLDGSWTSSLDRTAYVSAVAEVRERIAAGFVYQVNVCRVLTHALSDDADLDGLDRLVRQGNPAPHGSRIRCDEAGIDLVCASPELYLRRLDGRLVTRPIKGTAPTPELMLPKDHAENVMIVDLMRNDLSGVCEPGTVSVDELCVTEAHPGLVHLVSTVSGELRPGVEWPGIFDATFPPGSVSGAPKSSALTTIGDLERGARGPYCGAIGWVDADEGSAELAVGIRTFWVDRDSDGDSDGDSDRDSAGRRLLRFGTGAGITWHSDPEGEWRETELKAARLIGLAAGTVTP